MIYYEAVLMNAGNTP